MHYSVEVKKSGFKREVNSTKSYSKNEGLNNMNM